MMSQSDILYLKELAEYAQEIAKLQTKVSKLQQEIEGSKFEPDVHGKCFLRAMGTDEYCTDACQAWGTDGCAILRRLERFSGHGGDAR